RAYPNPVSDYLTVEYYLEDPAVITFQLTDSLGKLVLETAPAAQQAFRQTETLATGYLPPGTYFLTMRAGKQQLAQTTIVIQQKP
ncbi:MAG TPA: T9SS type A sorting domain-containing protein, partial [Saprospiraceae bacterium]|nr:T9SS type A sorting domain-containing protein [Saprospiraceae bacterium]